MKNFPVPFNGKGDQLSYPDYGHVMRPNEVFEDTLTYDDYGRGRSAMKFYFLRESTGTRVSMFAVDFSEIVPMLHKGAV